MKKLSRLKEFQKKIKFMIASARKSIILLETFDYKYVLEIIGKNIDNNSVIVYNNATRHVYNIGSEDSPLNSKTSSLGNFIPKFLKGELKNPNENYTKEVLSDKTLLVARITEAMLEDDGDTNEDRLLARLQDFVYQNSKRNNNKKTILLVATNHFEVSGLEHICERLSMPLPDKKDIHDELGLEIEWDDEDDKILNIKVPSERLYPFYNKHFEYYLDKDGNIVGDKDNVNHYEELVNALYGMNLYDIKELLRTIASESTRKEISYKLPKGTIIDRIKEGKKQIVSNSGLLEVVEYDKDYHENVADIENLTDYLNVEKKRIENVSLFPPNFPKPKGILLVGAPGCGKSESAKATASILELPLYRLNIGDLLGHKYGQSENRFAEALRTADASAPCVLWIDEIEKAFAGAGNEKENDDTLTHIVGRFLTWMQEHETMVYLVATANDLSKMKPEMLRKGRWDEKFYLTYPSEKGCIQILYSIIEKKYGIKLIYTNNKKIVEVFLKKSENKLNTNNAFDISDLIVYKKEHKNQEREEIVVNPTAYDIVQSLSGKMHRDKMSGAEIANTIIEVVIKAFNEQSTPKHEIKSIYIEKMLEALCASCENKESLTNDNDNKNCYKQRIDEDIRELRIQHLGRKIEDERELRNLLKERYENQYSANKYKEDGFKPASKFE